MSEQMPNYLIPGISGIELRLLCGVRIEPALGGKNVCSVPRIDLEEDVSITVSPECVAKSLPQGRRLSKQTNKQIKVWFAE